MRKCADGRPRHARYATRTKRWAMNLPSEVVPSGLERFTRQRADSVARPVRYCNQRVSPFADL